MRFEGFPCTTDENRSSKLSKNFIGKEKDSLRFYYLGNNYKNKVEHIGAKESYDVEDILIY